METQAVENNGGTVIQEAMTDYPFDAPTVTVEIPRGKSIVTVVMTKPSDQHYLNLQQAARIISRVIGEKIVDETPVNNAQEEFFDELVTGGSRRLPGEQSPSVTYTADECRKFKVEAKEQIVRQMLAVDCEVIGEGDDLFDEGSLTVKQVVGDPADPSYVIEYELSEIPKKKRLDYRLGSSKTEREIAKKSVLLTTDVHALNRAKVLFADHLSEITGGRIQPGAYSTELKKEYLAAIDSNFQVGVIEAAMRYYEKGQERARD